MYEFILFLQRPFQNVPMMDVSSARLFVRVHVQNYQTFGTSETAGNYHKRYKVSVTDRSSLRAFTKKRRIFLMSWYMVHNNNDNDIKNIP